MANFKALSSWLVNKEDDKPKRPERTAQKNEVFQETEDLVTFNEEILNGKLHFCLVTVSFLINISK